VKENGMRRTAVFLLIFGLAGPLAAESIIVPLPDAPTDEAVEVTVSTEAAPPETVAVTTTTLATPAPLKIVHPPAGARLAPLRTSFVYGSADPAGQLTVNGLPVAIHPGGGWLVMIPFSTGNFTIRAELRLGTETVTVTRPVFVASNPVTSPAKPLTIEYMKPDKSMELRPGDAVPVLVKGSPGMEAFFQIEGVHGKFSLVENAPDAPLRGIYRGSYVLQERDAFKDAEIHITLLDKKRDAKIVRAAPGRLRRMESSWPYVVEVATADAVLRAGPSFSAQDKLGYTLFPPVGVRMEAVARVGDELKIRLSRTQEAWISEKEIRPLRTGTPAPHTTVGSLSLTAKGRSTELRAPMGQKVPFAVTAAADGGWIEARLYGAVSNTDWAHYDSSGGVVSFYQWFQDDPETYRLRLETPAGSWWGYDARYEGSTFVLELRAPPPAVAKSTHVLEGLVVAVDAGHSSDIGSIGPTGLLEKDANLVIAKCLQKKLLAEKATVVMIREGHEHVPLYDRPRLAWRAKADVLISVHNNALPDGGNPHERNGYGVYYFQPQGFPLAAAIHQAYGEEIGRTGDNTLDLRDDGLHYGNLALARTTQMPAVLTESAYIMVPAEEALLKTADFQCACAEAMVAG